MSCLCVYYDKALAEVVFLHSIRMLCVVFNFFSSYCTPVIMVARQKCGQAVCYQASSPVNRYFYPIAHLHGENEINNAHT